MQRVRLKPYLTQMKFAIFLFVPFDGSPSKKSGQKMKYTYILVIIYLALFYDARHMSTCETLMSHFLKYT